MIKFWAGIDIWSAPSERAPSKVSENQLNLDHQNLPVVAEPTIVNTGDVADKNLCQSWRECLY